MNAVCMWCGSKGGFANFLIFHNDIVECEWCAASARIKTQAKELEQWA